MSSSDERSVPAAPPAGSERRSASRARSRADDEAVTGRPLSMLWRVFAANAAVFAVAFALLALAPVTLHASLRLEELVLLLAGLVVMLIADLLLLRHALSPLRRLAGVMEEVNLLQPRPRELEFEHSSSEVLVLAQAFNAMLDRLESERRESAGRVLSAQEAERQRIARELHDEVGQTLTAVALRAEHAARQAGEPRPELDGLAALVQDSLQDVRRISRELRPEALDELGLINALIALCSRVADQSGMRVHRRLEGPLPELSPETELAIYRITQEALTNAMRHAGASEATVSLTRANRDLTLIVSDDGRGLGEDRVEGGGLAGMRERAMLIGAELAIESTRGTGTTVRLQLACDGEG
jgi:two-component system sensor histidine kinase UhpB